MECLARIHTVIGDRCDCVWCSIGVRLFVDGFMGTFISYVAFGQVRDCLWYMLVLVGLWIWYLNVIISSGYADMCVCGFVRD